MCFKLTRITSGKSVPMGISHHFQDYLADLTLNNRNKSAIMSVLSFFIQEINSLLSQMTKSVSGFSCQLSTSYIRA